MRMGTRGWKRMASTPSLTSPSDKSDVTSSSDAYRPVIAASMNSESSNSEPQPTPLGLWQKSEATINRQFIRSLHSTHHQRRGSFQQMMDAESFAFLRRTSSNTRRTATAVSVAARLAPVQTQMDMTNRHSNRASGNSYYYRDDDNDDYSCADCATPSRRTLFLQFVRTRFTNGVHFIGGGSHLKNNNSNLKY